MVGITHPKREIHLSRVAAAVARQELLGGLVDVPVVYLGPARHNLYPERVGCRCRVVLVSETDHICPLIVEWPDGFRGIAEPEWLVDEVQ